MMINYYSKVNIYIVINIKEKAILKVKMNLKVNNLIYEGEYLNGIKWNGKKFYYVII